MSNPLLRLSDLRRHYGGVKAVDGVSLDVPEGTVYGLIGPNGAGKTTLVDLVTGYTRPDGGRVEFDGRDVTAAPPHAVAARGVARTFQRVRLYRGLTALENVVAGMHAVRRHDLLASLAVLPRRAAARDRAERARHLLATVGLDADRTAARAAGTLSYGDQRRVEIARALAAEPRLLVLDEPAAGMNLPEKDRMRDLLAQLNAGGLTILLIDHDMRLVMAACGRMAVLDFGRKIAEGSPAEVSADPEVLAAYLGERSGQPAPRRATAAGGRPQLEVSDLAVAYGPVRAVDGVSFTVAEGEVVALIGANGAGKSTILNALSGVVRAVTGTAVFDGLDLLAARPAAIVAQGLAHVPEGREILARLTVRENLELGAWVRRDRAAVARDIAGLEERFPILGQRRHAPAGQLSGGEQQLLAMARALVARPRLLLLDEPSLGLAPQLAEDVFRLVEELAAGGLSILLVEQNAYRALDLADQVSVLVTGRIALSGRAGEVRDDPEVQRAYLGG